MAALPKLPTASCEHPKFAGELGVKIFSFWFNLVHKNPCSRWWLQLGWNLAVFLILPEEYGDSRQLGKEAEPFLGSLLGTASHLRACSQPARSRVQRGGSAQGSVTLGSPWGTRTLWDEHFGGSQLSSHARVCENEASYGRKCKLHPCLGWFLTACSFGITFLCLPEKSV